MDNLIVSPDASGWCRRWNKWFCRSGTTVVVQDGLVLGLLTRASIGQFIELHQSGR
ncbi:MAG: hypothetical protein U0361_13175 [Nitrospiraceae bacterium]